MVQAPILPVPTAQNLVDFCSQVKQLLDLREGRSRAGFTAKLVTHDELAAYTPASQAGSSGSSSTPGSGNDTVGPAAPTSLTVTAGVFSNSLAWQNPTDPDFWCVEVWTNTSQDRSTASLLAVVTGPAASYEHTGIELTVAHYYWLRSRDWSGNYSAWEPNDLQGGGVAPAQGSTIDELLTLLVGRLDRDQLVGSLLTSLDQTTANANDALALAQGQVHAFFQTAAPTGGMVFADIWIDTDGADPVDTSCVYRYENATSHDSTPPLAWTAAPSSAIGAMLVNSYNAGAVTNVGATVFCQPNDPGTSAKPGDLWIDSNDLYRQYQRNASGSGWDEVTPRTQDALVQSLQSDVQLSNSQYGVKIQETSSGHKYLAGFGLVLYPTWIGVTPYGLGASVKYETTGGWQVYRSKAAGNMGHAPDSSPTWWEPADGVAQSEFVVLADKFQVLQSASDSGSPTPMFTVGQVGGQTVMGLNGNLLVDGLVQSRMLQTGSIKAEHVDASAVLASSVMSHGYLGGHGYLLDGVNNRIVVRDWTSLFSAAGDLPEAGADVTQGAIEGGTTITAGYLSVNDQAGICGEVTTGTDVRFWAGASYANRASAPFRVDENGKVIIKSAATGARLVLNGQLLSVYDANNVLRVKLGVF